LRVGHQIFEIFGAKIHNSIHADPLCDFAGEGRSVSRSPLLPSLQWDLWIHHRRRHERELAFGFVTNTLGPYVLMDPRAQSLARSVAVCLG